MITCLLLLPFEHSNDHVFWFCLCNMADTSDLHTCQEKSQGAWKLLSDMPDATCGVAHAETLTHEKTQSVLMF